MSWFSRFTDWVFDDILGFDPPKPPAQDPAIAALTSSLNTQADALRQQTAAASAATNAAVQAQKDAAARAEAASVPVIDSESARAAGDQRRRKLVASSPFGMGMAQHLAAPPVGFRVLSGSA